MFDYGVVARFAIFLIASAVLWIWLLDKFRSGQRKRAGAIAIALAILLWFTAVDRIEATGNRVEAVAVMCKPAGVRTPASCKFDGFNGRQYSLPTAEWVRPGDKVVLEEVRRTFSQTTTWRVANVSP